MDSSVYKAKEKELEPKYTSVPNVLFYWILSLVLQAINTVFLHNPAETIQRVQGRGQVHKGSLCYVTEHIAMTWFSMYLSYIAGCIGAVMPRCHRIRVSRMLHKISID